MKSHILDLLSFVYEKAPCAPFLAEMVGRILHFVQGCNVQLSSKRIATFPFRNYFLIGKLLHCATVLEEDCDLVSCASGRLFVA